MQTSSASRRPSRGSVGGDRPHTAESRYGGVFPAYPQPTALSHWATALPVCVLGPKSPCAGD